MKPPNACRWLENKSFFFPPLAEGAVNPASDEDPDAPTTPFWCNQTQDATGPDGDLACPDGCDAKRTCFAPEVDLDATPET